MPCTQPEIMGKRTSCRQFERSVRSKEEDCPAVDDDSYMPG
jgi:hypothetical protein